MRVFRFEDAKWTDPWGQEIRVVKVVAEVMVTEIDTWQRDTGYGIQEEKVYADPFGGVYKGHTPIDYYGGIYLIDQAGRFWRTRPHSPKVLDRDGSPIVWKEFVR